MKQEQVQARQRQDVEVEAVDAVAHDESTLTADIDAVLDDIDDILEENAEEFVRGFVQKGGQ